MKCDLCDRENELTFHHLIPKCLHRKKWFKVNYTKEELSKGINICKFDCHKEIHNLISNKDLGKNYNTLSKLKNHTKLKNYLKWLQKKNGKLFMLDQ